MKLHISDPQANGVYLQTDHGFNRKFDPATGEESVSLLVEPTSTRAWCLDKAAKGEDAKGLLAYYSCCFLGRAADLDRVKGVGVRMLEDSKIEVRLKLSPPWWWDEARQFWQGRAVA
jgi:hypothetical protein